MYNVNLGWGETPNSVYSQMPVTLNAYIYTEESGRKENKRQMYVSKHWSAFCECSVLDILPLCVEKNKFWGKDRLPLQAVEGSKTHFLPNR